MRKAHTKMRKNDELRGVAERKPGSDRSCSKQWVRKGQTQSIHSDWRPLAQKACRKAEVCQACVRNSRLEIQRSHSLPSSLPAFERGQFAPRGS
ncbi:hypothetical protein HUJ05_013345 [Dendroctonus ponderosae]|nr:hypothetical protein HUJ05_013342 [Dendroctonus ponderosae]KAH0999407.1 hypothetical protein HUJ05_013345 [Dendroctonus ponderosae]